MKKLLICAVCAVFMINAVPLKSLSVDNTRYREIKQVASGIIEFDINSGFKALPNEGYPMLNGTGYSESYYNQLSDYEKTIYDTKKNNVDAFLEGKVKKIEFSVLDSMPIDELVNSFYNAVFAFDYDYPEIFWMSKTMRLGYTKVGNEATGACFMMPEDGWYNTAYSSAEEVEAAIEAFDAKVLEIVSEAGDKPFEKMKYFHDWLINNNSYNKYVVDGEIDKMSPLAFSAASALIGDANSAFDDPVCEGYARAFAVLCKETELDCVLVSGKGNGGDHMWNSVLMSNGMWFAVDVTFDDPISSTPKLNYNNFLIGSDSLSENHTEEGNFIGYGTYKYPILHKYDYPINAEDDLGDVNSDGKINTADAVATLQFLAGNIVLSAKQKDCANINCDLKVNTADAVAVLKQIAG